MNLELFSDKLVEVLPRLMREIYRHESSYVKEGKVSLSGLQVLDYLSKNDSGKMSCVAVCLGLTKPAATALIEGLCQQGLVKRQSDSKDRRTVLVVLTPKGRNVHKQIYVQKKKAITSIFKSLSSDERRLYINIIEKLSHNFSCDGEVTKKS